MTPSEIEYAKDLLENNGYYVGNLWNIQDVKNFYECNDAQAMRVLDYSLNGNDYVTNAVWDMIDIVARQMELKKRDDLEII
jgi:hypothetical protein